MKVTKKQIFGVIALLVIVFSLPIAIFLTKKGQEIRPRALQGQANFLLSTDSTTSTVGKVINVVVSLQLTDSTLKASGVDFLLLYDKSKLDVLNSVPQIKSVNPAAPFTDAPIVSSGGVFDDTYNFVRVAEIARMGDQYLPAGTFTLAKVTFTGRAQGAANIKFPDDNKYLQIVGTGTYIPPTVAPPITSAFQRVCCSSSQLAGGYQCIQDCGPPVARVGDPTPGSSCLDPATVASSTLNGVRTRCPICLASNTMIAAPAGEKLVTALKTGDLVWTMDSNGKKTTQPIIRTSKTNVPATHKVSHLVLNDGREAWISPGHPAAGGKSVGSLKEGDLYDGARVVRNDLVSYWDSATYDILPAGDTGFYWANGILVGSTLKN